MLKKVFQTITDSPSRSDDPNFELSFKKYQDKAEQRAFSFFILLISIFQFGLLFTALIRQLPFFIFLVRIIFLFITFGVYIIGKKRLLTQKILLTSLVASSCYFIMNNIYHTSSNDLQVVFLIGNNYIVVELFFTLCFKSVQERYIVCLILTIFKSCVLRNDLPFSARIPVALSGPLFALIYYAFDNMQDRNTFGIIDDSCSKLQEILSANFPLGVLVTDLSLKNVVYSNRVLQAIIQGNNKNDDEEEIGILKSCFVDKNSSEKEKELISLYDFLKENSLEGNKTHIIGVYLMKENKKTCYEMKLSQILWNGETCYALIFSSEEKIYDQQQRDRLIANVAHEFRTPINGIMGLIEMTTPLINNQQALAYLENCKSTGKLLMYLVNSILNLNQLRHNKLTLTKESFTLNSLLEEIRSLYIFTCKQKGIDFIIQISSKVSGNIYTDRYKLMGVLINLLTNSIKFTFKGSVTLRISPDPQNLKNLIFLVEDTGIGIHENDKNKLFTAFGKVNHEDKSINSQGVGLGLTIASGLVEALNEEGGQKEKIEFESQYGKGTRFWFKISSAPSHAEASSLQEEASALLNTFDRREYPINSPATPEKKMMRYFNESPIKNKMDLMAAASPLSQRSSTVLGTLGSSPRCQMLLTKSVLLVDDIPLNLIAASFIMERLGYKVTKAYNGQEGIETLKKSRNGENKFDLIMTDIQMPVMDGLKMSRKIQRMIEKGEIHRVPVFCITANDVLEEELKMYRKNGISFVLKKPLEQEEVKEKLRLVALEMSQ